MNNTSCFNCAYLHSNKDEGKNNSYCGHPNIGCLLEKFGGIAERNIVCQKQNYYKFKDIEKQQFVQPQENYEREIPKHYIDFVNMRMSQDIKMDVKIYARRKLYSEVGELLGELTKHEAHGKELDMVNVVEELGDILFYFVFLGKRSFDTFGDYKKLSNACSDFIEMNNFGVEIDRVFFAAENEFEITLDQIIETNIAKLNKRPMPSEYYKSKPKPLDIQIGGNHYKDMAIQPVEFCTKNKLGFLVGMIIKYICRYNKKGHALADLNKAKHCIDLIIEIENIKE